VVGGSGPLLLAAAAYFRKHGAHVQVIVEQASRRALVRFGLQLLRSPAKMAQAAGLKLALPGIPYLPGCWVEAAEGDQRVERVHLRWHSLQPVRIVDCDYAAIAYGLCPNTELASLLGCRIEENAVAVDELQRTSVDDIVCAGECTGIGGVELSLVEGEIAGYAAAGQTDRARRLFSRRERARQFARALNSAFALRGELKELPRPETIVCRCEDVPFHRLQNMLSFRAAKLHTRCGMGPCQGRICGPAADFLFGWRTESIRPPIFPARVGSLVFETTTSEEASLSQ
jgi:NADPH-dependent 2,4-dienoyl-CoA reductase/sulfur reductase-like enzyme